MSTERAKFAAGELEALADGFELIATYLEPEDPQSRYLAALKECAKDARARADVLRGRG